MLYFIHFLIKMEVNLKFIKYSFMIGFILLNQKFLYIHIYLILI